MADIIITVVKENELEVEVKIDDQALVGETIANLVKVYSVTINEDALIQAEPNGIILVKSKSFAHQDVIHGALLSIVQSVTL